MRYPECSFPLFLHSCFRLGGPHRCFRTTLIISLAPVVSLITVFLIRSFLPVPNILLSIFLRVVCQPLPCRWVSVPIPGHRMSGKGLRMILICLFSIEFLVFYPWTLCSVFSIPPGLLLSWYVVKDVNTSQQSWLKAGYLLLVNSGDKPGQPSTCNYGKGLVCSQNTVRTARSSSSHRYLYLYHCSPRYYSAQSSVKSEWAFGKLYVCISSRLSCWV